MPVLPRIVTRGALAAAALLAALAAFALLAVRFGEQPVSLQRAFADASSTDAAIVFSLRLPRVALAVLVGAALSASGAALQALTRNPLADPFVLGVSGGAALGATAALALGLTAPGAALPVETVFAFAGALGAAALVFFLGQPGQSGPSAALLSGVVFNAIAAAVITAVKALAAPDQVTDILHWLAGALGYEPARTLLWAAAVQAVAIGALVRVAGRLNLLALGEDEAASLGVPVASTRRWVLAFASLSVACAVALSGLIGFVGLLVPHVLRRWLGPDLRLLLPASALGGAAFLVASDLTARVLFRTLQFEPPVGVVTAALGGPLFLWLLNRKPSANVR